MAPGEAGDAVSADEQLRSWAAQLQKFSVCQLTDALGPACSVETGIRPIDPQFRICGPALTVECPPGDNLTVHHALHVAQPGDVLIVNGSQNSDGALWGELMSISAQSKRLAGTIINGSVRDPVEIRNLGYPVFCRDFTPSRAAKQTYGHINVFLRFGKISIHPRDLVLADVNGVVCIRPVRAQQAINLASEIAQKESNIKRQICLGRTIFEILELEPFIGVSPSPPNQERSSQDQSNQK